MTRLTLTNVRVRICRPYHQASPPMHVCMYIHLYTTLERKKQKKKNKKQKSNADGRGRQANLFLTHSSIRAALILFHYSFGRVSQPKTLSRRGRSRACEIIGLEAAGLHTYTVVASAPYPGLKWRRDRICITTSINVVSSVFGWGLVHIVYYFW